jgi:23S rRNA (uracil1939-C5)-methyltransferase
MPTRILAPVYGGNFTSEDAEPRSYVLPGELVDAAGTILEPSAARIAPRCPHFGACGGCQYQHAAYSAQLALKSKILEDILTAAGLRNLPELRTHQAAEWGYRNRIRLRIEPSPETPSQPFRAGYSRRGSNDFLPIAECAIAAPLLWKAAETLLLLAATDSVCRRWLACVSELELFCAADESRLQLQFFLRDSARDPELLGSVCEKLKKQLPELAGAGAELDPELCRSLRRRWAGAVWGSPGLNYEASGRTYWVSRGAFFQVNRFLVPQLLHLVCEGASGELAWDLFAGVGLFTRALAETFSRVVAVEAGNAAAADLRTAAKRIPAVEPVHASTLDFLKARELQRDRPDLIVCDPPRAGLGPDVPEILARMAVPRLVYVSCDPTTLARDIAILTRSYRVDALDLIDLFPQTFHMETVVHLSLR